MLATAKITNNDEVSAIVYVEIQYNEFPIGRTHSYLVSIDKITERIVVHSEATTRYTRHHLVDGDDTTEIEEVALLCAICFPAASTTA